ncbi:MAG TPA: cellulase family glycosylhydrolase [Chloroflexota bacterium]
MKRIIFILMGLLVLAAAALATNAGGIRSAATAAVPTEQRNQIIALTSRWNARKVDTADLVPMRCTGMNPVGVNTFLEQEPDVAKRRQSLQMIKDAGIGWIRQQFPWEDIEIPSKGKFWDEKFNQSTWDKYDNIVNLANEYGIQVIARLDLPPRWAHPGNEWSATPPDNFDDYGDFVYSVVSRYKGKVRFYQLWNEPNLSIEWGGKPVDAKEYVRLLQAGYRRAKEADPNAVVISAALAPTIEESWRALSDLKYLQQMYDAGAKDSFDIMSVMAYGLRSGPDDRRLDFGDVNFSRPIRTREIMVRNGDAAKPIWASEMGWNTQPESVTAAPTFGRVSEALQASYTVRAFQRAAEEWPWMGVMSVWFFKRADDHESDQPFYYFRMVDPDFTPRPVYGAIKALATKPPNLRVGYSPADNRAVAYTGNWQQGSLAGTSTVRFSTAGGATVGFYFKGSDLTLLAPRGKELGLAHVVIDGQSVMANRLLRDASGKAAVDLRSDQPVAEEQIPLATGLPNEPHRVEIQAAGPFAVDGFIVQSREPDLAWWLFGTLAIVAVPLAVGGVLLVAARRRKRPSPAVNAS